MYNTESGDRDDELLEETPVERGVSAETGVEVDPNDTTVILLNPKHEAFLIGKLGEYEGRNEGSEYNSDDEESVRIGYLSNFYRIFLAEELLKGQPLRKEAFKEMLQTKLGTASMSFEDYVFERCWLLLWDYATTGGEKFEDGTLRLLLNS